VNEKHDVISPVDDKYTRAYVHFVKQY
jgi:hypothetical protein